MRRLAAAFLLVLAGSGCVADAPGPASPASPGATLAATVAPHAWLVAEIAGDDAEVVTVLPPTADPHSHLPTDAEASRLARASLLFRSGVPIENGSWFSALTSRDVVSVDLQKGVGLLDDSHHHGAQSHAGHDQGDNGHPDQDHPDQDYGADPHTWLSPRRLVIQARTVAAALSESFPDRAEDFARRSDALVARLQALDAELAQRLAPHRGRSFLVLHPSWSYFADDYGLRQMAIESGGSAPSDAEITALLRRARDAGIRTVFVQPQSAQRIPAAVAEALGADVETLDPLAPDVPANLRRVADRLIASWQNSGAARP